MLKILWNSDRMIGEGTSAYKNISFETCTRLSREGLAHVAHIPMGSANRMGESYHEKVLITMSGDNPWN
ncbi:MAG: hypothetical protein ABIH76_02860, partial [Candidatus Bathyarchaeota archaeon]